MLIKLSKNLKKLNIFRKMFLKHLHFSKLCAILPMYRYKYGSSYDSLDKPVEHFG